MEHERGPVVAAPRATSRVYVIGGPALNLLVWCSRRASIVGIGGKSRYYWQAQTQAIEV